MGSIRLINERVSTNRYGARTDELLPLRAPQRLAAGECKDADARVLGTGVQEHVDVEALELRVVFERVGGRDEALGERGFGVGGSVQSGDGDLGN